MLADWQQTSTDCVFAMQFNGENIGHLTKIWDAGVPMHDRGRSY
jgi:hypothetical protein